MRGCLGNAYTVGCPGRCATLGEERFIPCPKMMPAWRPASLAGYSVLRFYCWRAVENLFGLDSVKQKTVYRDPECFTDSCQEQAAWQAFVRFPPIDVTNRNVEYFRQRGYCQVASLPKCLDVFTERYCK